MNVTTRVTCTLSKGARNESVLGIMYQLGTENVSFCSTYKNNYSCNIKYDLICEQDTETVTGCLYRTPSFWAFVILMSIGTICFNVTNSISDAICFDVIGKFTNDFSSVSCTLTENPVLTYHMLHFIPIVIE